MFDVAVDIRKRSPSFGKHLSAELTAEKCHQLNLPAGFVDGFCTLTPDRKAQYKLTHCYDRACERRFAWDDPVLGINRPLNGALPIVSDKDAARPRLGDLPDYSVIEPPAGEAVR